MVDHQQMVDNRWLSSYESGKNQQQLNTIQLLQPLLTNHDYHGHPCHRKTLSTTVIQHLHTKHASKIVISAQ